jgi:hypothetical protein
MQTVGHETRPSPLCLDRKQIDLAIRVALEEMVFGRNYARVEDILRALASQALRSNAE